MNINEVNRERMRIAGNRCERIVVKSRKGDTRCPNVHRELSKTHKGRVNLAPHEIKSISYTIENIRMYCFSCRREIAEAKFRMKKPKSVEAVPNQLNLFSEEV